MGKARGFLEFDRAKAEQRPVPERLKDWREFELPLAEPKLREQATRCMDCGIPFCHQGCPLGNLIPDFNDHVHAGRWEEAAAALQATNNFPEVTGRVCPAPCEASCVLNLQGAPVSIKNIERALGDREVDAGPLVPQRSQLRTSRRVVIIGSGPAGLAAAQQLARKGHDVTVLEKDDRLGGLLRYGIPDFKMEKDLLDRRLEQLRAEGVEFQTGVHAGVDVTGEVLLAKYDAVLLAGGAMKPRELGVPGRELDGVHLAMEFLTQQNRRSAGLPLNGRSIDARGKRVVVLGGGDTGSDCIGTSHRQGALSVTSLELMPKPPEVRSPQNPWPAWPLILRTSSSHEEGGRRDFGVLTRRLVGEAGRVTGLEAVRVELREGAFHEVEGSTFVLPCELVLLAMGFVGSEKGGVIEQLGLTLDARGNVPNRKGQTSVGKVFVAGDMSRGPSLVVWAIAEGRQTAERVDAFLTQPQPSLRAERR